jgi:hypothetical protein
VVWIFKVSRTCLRSGCRKTTNSVSALCIIHGYGHGLKQKTIDVNRLGHRARASQSGEGHPMLDSVEKRFVSQLAQTTTITAVSSASLAGPEHC